MPSKDSGTKFILRHLLIGVGIGGAIVALGGYALLSVSGDDSGGGAWTVVLLFGSLAAIAVAMWFGGLSIYGFGRRLGKPWAGRPPRGLPAALRRLAFWSSYPALPEDTFSPVDPPMIPGRRRRKRRRAY